LSSSNLARGLNVQRVPILVGVVADLRVEVPAVGGEHGVVDRGVDLAEAHHGGVAVGRVVHVVLVGGGEAPAAAEHQLAALGVESLAQLRQLRGVLRAGQGAEHVVRRVADVGAHRRGVADDPGGVNVRRQHREVGEAVQGEDHSRLGQHGPRRHPHRQHRVTHTRQREHVVEVGDGGVQLRCRPCEPPPVALTHQKCARRCGR
jgi:hypothetical protein